MQPSLRVWAANRRCLLVVAIIAAAPTSAARAASGVEFDFARTAECRDVTCPGSTAASNNERFVELTLSVSVRFRGVSPADVDELDIEINGAPAGLRVASFSPTTQLASDLTQAIETTTTTRLSNSLDATLGGTLPTPYSELVAHVTPSISAGTSRSESATEKVTRLPPRRAVVVSGTSLEGRGVFFKLKKSSQNSLEGVHPLVVTFRAPADWQAGAVRVFCTARGQRKILLLKQPATLGRVAGDVKLRLLTDAADTNAAEKCEAADDD
jgi:hypothetical protein